VCGANALRLPKQYRPLRHITLKPSRIDATTQAYSPLTTLDSDFRREDLVNGDQQ